MAGELSLKTPLTGLVTLVPTNTATDKTITLPATTGTMVVQDGTNTTTVVNLAYTGTLTGGTGVVNLGSGQVYKDASGNVGIGTSSPTGKLHVNGGTFDSFTISGNSTNSVGMRFQNSAASSRNWNIGSSGGGPSSAGSFFIYDDTAAATRMSINSSGNVGIGTTAGTTTVSSGLAINNATAANYPGLEIQTAGVTRLYFNANNAESYITSVSTNPLVISTNGSERMRIDSSGNVGIGTGTTSNVRLSSNAATGSWAGTFYANSGGASTTGLSIYGLSFGGNYSNGSAEVNIVYGSAGAGLDFSSYNGTTITPCMRLDSSGNLLVGGISSPATARIYSKGASTVSEGICVQEVSGGGSTRFYVGFYNSSNTKTGDITTTGTTTAYNTTSDYRLKENVAPMQNALATVAALKPCTYTWKANGSDGQGFIAHELQAVVPDCVTGEKDAVDKDGKPQYQGVDTSFLVATLTAAIQELTARLEVLENK